MAKRGQKLLPALRVQLLGQQAAHMQAMTLGFLHFSKALIYFNHYFPQKTVFRPDNSSVLGAS